MLHKKVCCYIYDSLIGNEFAITAFLQMIRETTNKMPSGIHCEIHVIVPADVAGWLSFMPTLEDAYNIHSILEPDDAPLSLFSYCREVRIRIGFIDPQYIYTVSSTLGRTITSWLATTLDTGVIADATELEYDPLSGHMMYTRSTDSDSLLSTITFMTFPEVASIRPKSVNTDKPLSSLSGLLEDVKYTANGNPGGIKILSRTRIDKHNLNSRIVIGVGRGVSSHALSCIRTFTDKYGIPLLCTRPLVERDEFPRHKQIGQSGNSVQADLYIAVGISGATQHMIGLLNCHKIVAINNDPAARIHQLSDISIINDAEAVFGSLLEM